MNSTTAPDDYSSMSDSSDEGVTPSLMSVEIKEVKEELDASGFHAVCFVGILDDPKSAARTMSKTQKKTVMKGVLDLNHHDALFSHCMGLSSFDTPTDSNIAVFTSHPRIFAESTMKTYDVGQNAGHLSQTPDVAELCEGVRICVVLIGYDTDQHPINHDVLLRELEMYSDITGMKILHVDTTNTGRWYQHTNGEVVVLGENNIGFTCNDQELSDKFEAWSNDKSYEDVLSCQVVDWLEEMSKEETLNESMSVAFPAEIHDEVQDSQPPMDALLGEEDQALADRHIGYPRVATERG